jgi:uncharacterized membrane protein
MNLRALCLMTFGAVASSLSLPSAAAEEVAPGATFSGIGDLAGGPYESVAYDVSADGARVVGYSVGAAGKRAILWAAERGVVELAGEAGEARAISHAGDVVVGVTVGSRGYRNAVRWVNGTEPEVVTFSSYYGIERSEAWGVSGDGQLILGEAKQFGGVPFGFTWQGTQTSLGKPYLNAASADGSTLVGVSVPEREGFSRAVRNRDPLPFPFGDCTGPQCPCLAPDQCEAEATDVSADGNVIVGWAYQQEADALVAVSWAADASGMITPSVLSGSATGQALGVSADGRVVVGYEVHDGRKQATRWVGGVAQSLSALLEQSGTELRGWSLRFARAASADGRVIVGEGLNPNGDVEGWVATVPAP